MMAIGKEEPELLDVIKLLRAKTPQKYHTTELQLLRIWVCRGYTRLLVLSLLKMSTQVTTQRASKPQQLFGSKKASHWMADLPVTTHPCRHAAPVLSFVRVKRCFTLIRSYTFHMGDQEGFLHGGGGQASERAAQGSGGVPISGGV